MKERGTKESSKKQEEVMVRGITGVGRKLLDEPRTRDAFLGISLDKSISDRHLAMYIRWVLNHCRHCPVLIDDIEFRHNYMVFNNMDEEQATNLALRRGSELGARIAAIVARETYPYKEVSYIKSNPEDHRSHAIGVGRSSEDFGWGLISKTLETLTRGYEEDDEFRRDVDLQVEKGMGKKLSLWKTRVTDDEYKAGRTKLSGFVLEEAAATILQVQKGYAVELYAGQPILAIANLYDFQNNKYPELREALNLQDEYGHISLGIE